VFAAMAGACIAGGSACRDAQQAAIQEDVDARAETVRAIPDLVVVEAGASPGAEVPNLTLGADGTVVASWIQGRAAGGHVLRYRHRESGGWSAVGSIVESERLFVNWADFPAVTTESSGRMIAAWLEYDPSGSGYGVQWSRMGAEGAWSTPTWLHEHIGGPEYGFVSFAGDPAGTLAVFWLDGRASGGHDGGGQMQLRSATLGPDGVVTQRRLLDDRVCDCCQTAAASTKVGPVVAYRDRSEDEVRDIRLAGPSLAQTRRVGDDGWKIAGCPVNGPAVTASEGTIAVAWFTAAADDARVRVAFADLVGPFSAPIDVHVHRAIGRVDIVWADESSAVVSFLEVADQRADATLVVRLVHRNGELGPPFALAETSASNASGFPRMVRTGDHLVWAWTQTHDQGPPTIRFAEAPLSALRG
jgi:hypothetical protein